MWFWFWWDSVTDQEDSSEIRTSTALVPLLLLLLLLLLLHLPLPLPCWTNHSPVSLPANQITRGWCHAAGCCLVLMLLSCRSSVWTETEHHCRVSTHTLSLSHTLTHTCLFMSVLCYCVASCVSAAQSAAASFKQTEVWAGEAAFSRLVLLSSSFFRLSVVSLLLLHLLVLCVSHLFFSSCSLSLRSVRCLSCVLDSAEGDALIGNNDIIA